MNMRGGKQYIAGKRICLTNKPLITVVTVAFNAEKTIERTILSVLNQQFSNIEYIIIDGGSMDNTIEIIKKYDEKIDFWVSEPDQGIYDAMNKGIQWANGRWIHLVNADDEYYDRHVLERVSTELKEPSKHFYYCNMVQKFSDRSVIYRYSYNFINYLKLYYSAYLPHPTMFVAKEQYDSIGLFNTRYRIAADHDLTLRLCKKYIPVNINIISTIMNLGGYSSIHMEDGFKEFSTITIANGLNKHIAHFFYIIKKYKHRIISNFKKI